jgi:hypothetical protein
MGTSEPKDKAIPAHYQTHRGMVAMLLPLPDPVPPPPSFGPRWSRGGLTSRNCTTRWAKSGGCSALAMKGCMRRSMALGRACGS